MTIGIYLLTVKSFEGTELGEARWVSFRNQEARV